MSSEPLPQDPPPLIVFSDLDGTLLDHETYSFSAAAPMLARLRRLRIPVILASSKTKAEMIPIRRDMELGPVPMICENGAGIVGAQDGTVSDDDDYRRLRAVLDTLPAGVREPFEGFGDMGAARIAEVTGLSGEQARLAARRSFSEPGLWHADDAGRRDLIAALAEKGIAARMGGRFLTLSFGATKADRMQQIADKLGAARSVALGDAPNDLEMLNAADFGIIVANPHRDPLPEQPGEAAGLICRTTRVGPAGWSDGLSALLSDLNIAD